jgi:hypothetical protein
VHVRSTSSYRMNFGSMVVAEITVDQKVKARRQSSRLSPVPLTSRSAGPVLDVEGPQSDALAYSYLIVLRARNAPASASAWRYYAR